jgi:glycosyltransferase involved in cell wall biosynthesis
MMVRQGDEGAASGAEPLGDLSSAAPLEVAAAGVPGPRKVAFVHEWFTHFAGSEKVLEAMHGEFPDADMFALIDLIPEDQRPAFLKNKKVRTTFLQNIPFIEKFYRLLLPLMPVAIEQLDLTGYDLVISNSHAVAKGVITGPDQLHICMCYTPMRYAWDLQEHYIRNSSIGRGPLQWLVRWQLHKIRMWDVRTSNGVDHFIAVSKYIGRRIWKVYRRESDVIHCTVDVDKFPMGAGGGDFYLAASRVVPYKKLQLIVEAFALMPTKKLVVIGSGPGLAGLHKAAGPNVTIMGYQPDAVLLAQMQAARAFIFAAEEDFGIIPVEAQACGCPVIAYAKGGASETVIDGVTGVHFHEQTTEAIRDAVEAFERRGDTFDRDAIRKHSMRFSGERFRQEFRTLVTDRWAKHVAALRGA